MFTNEVMQILGISRPTLKSWERRGKLVPTRNELGWRIYNKKDVEKLKNEKSNYKKNKSQ